VLKETNPDLPDNVVGEVASNYAQQYIQGQQRSFVRNPLFNTEQGTEPITGERLPYYVKPGLANRTGTAPKDYGAAIEEAQDVIGRSDLIALDLDNQEVIEQARQTRFGGNENLTDDFIKTRLKSLKEVQRNELNRVLEPFKDLGSYNYLVEEKGMDELEAAAIVANQKAQNNTIKWEADNTFYPTDVPELKPKILSDLKQPSAKEFAVYKETDEGLEKQDKGLFGWGGDKPITEYLADENIEVDNVGFDFDKQHVVLTVQEGNDFENYRVPFKAIGNTGMERSLKQYGDFMSAYTGSKEPGEYVLGNESGPRYMLLDVDYDEDTGDFKKDVWEIVTIDGKKMRQPVPIQEAIKTATSTVFDYYGEMPEYITKQGARTRTR